MVIAFANAHIREEQQREEIEIEQQFLKLKDNFFNNCQIRKIAMF